MTLPAPVPPEPGLGTGTRPQPGPWGPGFTALFGALIFLAYSIVQGVAIIPMMLLEKGGPAGLLTGAATAAKAGGLPFSGFTLAFGTAFSCPAMFVFCAFFVLVRRGPSLADYLALRPVRVRAIVGWVIAMEILVLGLSSLNEFLGRPAPEFIVHTYASAGHLAFFWSTIALCAPVAEEVLFRGFLFPGLTASRLGPTGTVLLTATSFAIVHGGQYDWVDLLQVGIVGLALGWARLRSGSLLPPIAMHVALNLTSLTLYARSLAP